MYVIDNNSQKEDADRFYAGHKDIRLYRLKENTGFIHAVNLGVSKGTSPIVFLLNSDVELCPDAIQNACKAMDRGAAIVGMKLLFPLDIRNDPIRPAGMVQHVGISSNIRGELIHHLVGWHPDNPKVLAVSKVLAVTGAAFMTSRVLWNKYHGFDLIYGTGTWEECDFCFRAQADGLSVMLEQSAVGYHVAGGTANGQKISFPMQQNASIFQSRWAGRYPWTEWEHF